MVGTVEASSGTRNIGSCNSCAKGAPKTDLYSCTTCKENSATAADAEFLVCGRCIAKTHKGHDYQELDVFSKKDMDRALQEVQSCREACGAKEKALDGKKVDILASIERMKSLLHKREHALVTIVDDLRSDNELNKPQLMEKMKESEKIKKELEEGVFADANDALEECHRKLSDIVLVILLFKQDARSRQEADAPVLVVENVSDESAPPPARRRRMLTPARRGMVPRLSDILGYPQASASGTREARPAAATAQVPDASVVTVDDDEAVAASPSRRRRTVRQSMNDHTF